MLYIKEVVPGVLFGGGLSGGTLVMSQNISDQASIESWLYSLSTEDGMGIPITLMDNAELWTHSYYRYFLEQTNSTEIHLSFKPKKSKEQSSQDLGKDAFRQGCKRILRKKLSDVSNEDFLKAKKWCVTYKKTEYSGREPENESNTSFWKSKKSTSESDIKDELDKVKTILVENGGTDLKRFYKWCKMAMQASEDYSKKDKIEGICFNNSTGAAA